MGDGHERRTCSRRFRSVQEDRAAPLLHFGATGAGAVWFRAGGGGVGLRNAPVKGRRTANGKRGPSRERTERNGRAGAFPGAPGRRWLPLRGSGQSPSGLGSKPAECCAPAFFRSLAALVWPAATALSSGVAPESVATFTAAPCVMRSPTLAGRNWAAKWSGVAPITSSVASVSAPASRSSLTLVLASPWAA